jgi:hypothetical protein
MFTPSSPKAREAAGRALAALGDFEAGDQLEAMGLGTVAVLGALRSCFEQTPEGRQVFDLLCSEAVTWLRREIEKLRFEKAH